MATKNDPLYEALYNAGTDPAKFLTALGPLLVAVFPTGAPATPEPKPSDLTSMGIRPAGSNAEQALVNIRLGWSAQADRRLFLPEEAAGRAASWPKVASKYLAIGIPADMAEYGYLADFPEFQAVESFKDLSGYLSNYVGLSLHDKLLSDISQTGTPSGGPTV